MMCNKLFPIGLLSVVVVLSLASFYANDVPEANIKVAVLGDTDAGTNFQSVLQLVKNEGAQPVLEVILSP